MKKKTTTKMTDKAKKSTKKLYNKTTDHKTAVAVGVGTVAALAAGAYFLYGSKQAAKNRRTMKGWMLKMKGEILDKLEKLKTVDEKVYYTIIANVAEKYAKSTKVDETELKLLVEDMKKHWTKLSKDIDKVKKKLPASKNKK